MRCTVRHHPAPPRRAGRRGALRARGLLVLDAVDEIMQCLTAFPGMETARGTPPSRLTSTCKGSTLLLRHTGGGESMGKDHLAFMIRDSVRAHGAKTAMRYRDGGTWHSISYAELGEKIQAVTEALLESGIQEGDMVGIFARNAPEWAIADFAVLSAK